MVKAMLVLSCVAGVCCVCRRAGGGRNKFMLRGRTVLYAAECVLHMLKERRGKKEAEAEGNVREYSMLKGDWYICVRGGRKELW